MNKEEQTPLELMLVKTVQQDPLPTGPIRAVLTRAASEDSGAVAVEAAVVYPVVVFMFLGLVVGGCAVLRYQQVACQAREAARWASVRGANYALQTNQTSPTKEQILQQAVWPMAAGMNTNSLTIDVLLVNQSSGAVTDWDSALKDVTSLNGSNAPINNTVRVTVTYQLSSGPMLPNGLTVQSTSEIPMSF